MLDTTTTTSSVCAGQASMAHDVVLSSGFLAFAQHAGFLQAVEEVGARAGMLVLVQRVYSHGLRRLLLAAAGHSHHCASRVVVVVVRRRECGWVASWAPALVR